MMLRKKIEVINRFSKLSGAKKRATRERPLRCGEYWYWWVRPGPSMGRGLKFYGKPFKNGILLSKCRWGIIVYETLERVRIQKQHCLLLFQDLYTQETLSNATTIKKWFMKHATQRCSQACRKRYLLIQRQKYSEFGIGRRMYSLMWIGRW